MNSKEVIRRKQTSEQENTSPLYLMKRDKSRGYEKKDKKEKKEKKKGNLTRK